MLTRTASPSTISRGIRFGEGGGKGMRIRPQSLLEEEMKGERNPAWTSRKQDSYRSRFCFGEFSFWLNSTVILRIASRTYRSIATFGRLPFPLAYLKRVVSEGPSCAITRWNSRHIRSQLQDVCFLRLSSFLGSVSSFGADFFVFTESFGLV